MNEFTDLVFTHIEDPSISGGIALKGTRQYAEFRKKITREQNCIVITNV